jgi:hypothetical protein
VRLTRALGLQAPRGARCRLTARVLIHPEADNSPAGAACQTFDGLIGIYPDVWTTKSNQYAFMGCCYTFMDKVSLHVCSAGLYRARGALADPSLALPMNQHWLVQNRFLFFKFLPGRHTGALLARPASAFLTKHGLARKMSPISLSLSAGRALPAHK